MLEDKTAKKKPQRELKPMVPALAAGAAQAVLFNPVDRALYLRVHNREKSLFVMDNWRNPFQGFLNAAVYRTLSSATYLFYQDVFLYLLENSAPPQVVDNPYLLQFSVGLFAGAANGSVLNPIQIVKYRLWSTSSATGPSVNFFEKAWQIYQNAGGGVRGLRIFFRGAGVSVLRDVSFGVAYEGLRTPGLAPGTDPTTKFCIDIASGSLASVVSSPFNLVRNLIFGSSTRASPLGIYHLLNFFFRECAAHQNPIRHMNARLNLGFGTLRVGLGLGLGQAVFAAVHKRQDEKKNK